MAKKGDALAKMALTESVKALNALSTHAEKLAEFVDDLDVDRIPDAGAELKRVRDALEKIDKAIKARVIENAKDGKLRGVHFSATVTEQVRWNIDTRAVKAEMGEDWVTARSKPSHVKSVRYGV